MVYTNSLWMKCDHVPLKDPEMKLFFVGSTDGQESGVMANESVMVLTMRSIQKRNVKMKMRSVTRAMARAAPQQVNFYRELETQRK